MDVSGSPAKRRLLRIPLPVELVGKDEERPRFLGYLADVSLSGGFVQCSSPREQGTRLSIQLRLPGVAQPVRVPDAEVIWTRGYLGVRGRSPGMGVQFRELEPAARAVLEKFCSSDSIAGVVEILPVGPVD
jgi:Tfp pilus assembly protein PilZ